MSILYYFPNDSNRIQKRRETRLTTYFFREFAGPP